MTRDQLLPAIREYSVLPCDLAHEKVAMDGNGKPVIRVIENQMQDQRIALCPITTRKTRLGCAHSISNSAFRNLLESLPFR